MTKQAELVLDPRAVTLEGLAAVERAARPAQQPLRATAIKAGRLSMAHMHLALTEEREDTPAMRWGRLIHLAILEPVKLARLPQWEGGKRAGKAWDAFVEESGGGEYLMPGELGKLETITAETRRPLATMPPIVQTEVTVNWADPICLDCTARIDALLKGGGFLELKSSKSIQKDAFLSNAYKLGYHLQLGWYHHGLEVTERAGQVRVLLVESVKPYKCACYDVSPELLRKGYEQAQAIAAAYRACESVNQFPGPYDDVTLQYELPAYALGGDNAEVYMEGAEEL